MSTDQAAVPAPRRPIRLWPGVSLAIALLVLLFVVPVALPDYMAFGFLGSVLCGFGIALWWLFASRAPWVERLVGVALMAGAIVATRPILDPSIRTGAMGMLFYLLAIPTMTAAFVAGVAATAKRTDVVRRIAAVAGIAIGCGGWALLRTGGFTGDGKQDLSWRWAMTPEDRLLAQQEEVPASLAAAPPPEAPTTPAPAAEARPNAAPPSVAEAVKTPEPSTGRSLAESTPSVQRSAPPVGQDAAAPTVWPGFRGPDRDGHVRGLRIATDWSASPPRELWRRAVGPGWSSFAVRSGLVYTQEQRGEDEVVASYRLATGEPVWRHKDPARFWESNGGAGPRGTPTLAGGRVYTLGGTGLVNALDAATGAVAWSRDAAADTGAKTPMWGFSGSPLVVDDLVIVAASGALVAYDRAGGEKRWVGPVRGPSYSSPQLATIGGVRQVLLMSGTGVASVAPADGALLWEHKAQQPGVSIVQPALTADGDVLVAAGDSMGGSGIRRLAVAHGPAGWSVEERWMSKGLKPYFNDFVVHESHAYGFDGTILACIDLQDGQRKWKGGRYGAGQLVLLPDQDLLLVLSEQGELALVKAQPDAFAEVARVPAIQGKTWSHPALVGDVLLVRNSEEMAAFRLARAAEASRASFP